MFITISAILVTVKIIFLLQSNEVRNSAWMEHEGFVRAVKVLTDSGPSIAELITDRHKQNTAWIKRNLLNTTHYLDIWHVPKGTCTMCSH